MTSMTIRDIDDALKERLRMQAARHGRSMQAEARDILRAGLSGGEPRAENLAEAIHARFARFGGVELDLPKREPIPEPINFDE